MGTHLFAAHQDDWQFCQQHGKRICLHDAYEKNFTPQWWGPYRKTDSCEFLFVAGIYLNSEFGGPEFKWEYYSPAGISHQMIISVGHTDKKDGR